MKEFEIKLTPKAEKDLDKLNDTLLEKIFLALQVLKQNPFPQGKRIKKLKGTKSVYHRLRMDDYRAFYFIAENTVSIIRIISKKDSAKFIKQLK